MRLFKKYVTCITTFFTPVNCLSHFGNFVAQLTAKTANSEKAINRLFVTMTCSINKLKSFMLFSCNDSTEILSFPI